MGEIRSRGRDSRNWEQADVDVSVEIGLDGSERSVSEDV
jgi:hypothetical protein